MKPLDATRNIQVLREYYVATQTIPSLSILTRLWNYRAKSWTAAVVARLKQLEVLIDAPGRRLIPGPRFFHDLQELQDFSMPAVPTESAARMLREDRFDRAEATWSCEVTGTVAEAYTIAVRLVAAATAIEKGFRNEARALGVNAGELLVLDALRRLGTPYESSAALLKDHFLISFAGIGKRVGRLLQLGYVVRRTNPADRRSQIIRLTSAGLALLRDGLRNRYAPHIQALLELPHHDRKQLHAILRRLQTDIERTTAA